MKKDKKIEIPKGALKQILSYQYDVIEYLTRLDQSLENFNNMLNITFGDKTRDKLQKIEKLAQEMLLIFEN